MICQTILNNIKPRLIYAHVFVTSLDSYRGVIGGIVVGIQ